MCRWARGPPTFRTTVCCSATPRTTHAATEHHVADCSTRMIRARTSEVPGTKLESPTTMTGVLHGFSWSLHKHWDVHKFAANANYYPKPQENTIDVTI
jgi:hypothetical protein